MKLITKDIFIFFRNALNNCTCHNMYISKINIEECLITQW